MNNRIIRSELLTNAVFLKEYISVNDRIKK